MQEAEGNGIDDMVWMMTEVTKGLNNQYFRKHTDKVKKERDKAILNDENSVKRNNGRTQSENTQRSEGK